MSSPNCWKLWKLHQCLKPPNQPLVALKWATSVVFGSLCIDSASFLWESFHFFHCLAFSPYAKESFHCFYSFRPDWYWLHNTSWSCPINECSFCFHNVVIYVDFFMFVAQQISHVLFLLSRCFVISSFSSILKSFHLHALLSMHWAKKLRRVIAIL